MTFETKILRRNQLNSSEELNETSEEMFLAYVGNKKYPRGDLNFPTWRLEVRGRSLKRFCGFLKMVDLFFAETEVGINPLDTGGVHLYI